jgi:hypothetical protein
MQLQGRPHCLQKKEEGSTAHKRMVTCVAVLCVWYSAVGELSRQPNSPDNTADHHLYEMVTGPTCKRRLAYEQRPQEPPKQEHT